MAKTITKVLYGSTAILKGYCKECQQNAFILGGRFACCNALVEQNYDRERVKREVEGENKRGRVPWKVKQKILAQQENRCIYCEKTLNKHIWNTEIKRYVKLRLHFDHFVSWEYSRDNNEYNLYASCHICNGIKSDLFFYNLGSAKEYILEKRKEKGYL